MVFGLEFIAGKYIIGKAAYIIGFTSKGVLNGSLAALWQAKIGNVVAGSLFSFLQSSATLGTAGIGLGGGLFIFGGCLIFIPVAIAMSN